MPPILTFVPCTSPCWNWPQTKSYAGARQFPATRLVSNPGNCQIQRQAKLFLPGQSCPCPRRSDPKGPSVCRVISVWDHRDKQALGNDLLSIEDFRIPHEGP